ncbi:MAG: 3-hydroxybutyryl-CoA dehydrogenase [Dehalococcoidia bacterium]|nr:3-hydroxybutyryl-CoA dehydrogenase [Dehalococcoidia bacterium]
MKKVGVVGCGTMGGGIAQVCAQAGYSVTVSEANEELLQKGLGAIKSILARNVERGRMTQPDADAVIGRIKGTMKMSDFADCDIVIEAILENMEIKKKVFGELDKICPPHAILATNTSSLSITDMAMATKRPAQVIGLHFFNPAPLMKLAEVVRTILTSDETIQAGKKFGESLGKTAVVAKDSPGFIVNRLAVPFLLDAVRMLESGYASREDIDAGINMGLNHPMGPLALADLIGLDIIVSIADAMYYELKDSQFACPPLIKKMVTAGWLGRKTKKGFYNY